MWVSDIVSDMCFKSIFTRALEGFICLLMSIESITARCILGVLRGKSSVSLNTGWYLRGQTAGFILWLNLFMGIASEIDCAACDTVLLKLVLHLARSVVALVVYIPLFRLLPGQPLSVNRCLYSYHISLIVRKEACSLVILLTQTDLWKNEWGLVSHFVCD
jgi:hypothetical protein